MLLELNEVSKSFGGVAALTGVSFGVKQGEVFINWYALSYWVWFLV